MIRFAGSPGFTNLKYVSIKKSKHGYELLSFMDFMKMPLQKRLELCKEGMVSFLDKEGEKIPQKEAMLELARLIKQND